MIRRITLGLLLGTISLSSSAIDLDDISLGANVGSFKYDSGMASETAIDKESSFSLQALYDFQDNLKIELAASSLGDYTLETHSTSFSSVTASLIAQTTVLNDFQPYAKFGYGFMNMTQNIDFLDTEIESKTTGDTFVAGFGVEYTNEYLANVSLRLSYDYYYFKTSKLFGSEESSNNLRGLSLGILYHFN